MSNRYTFTRRRETQATRTKFAVYRDLKAAVEEAERSQRSFQRGDFGNGAWGLEDVLEQFNSAMDEAKRGKGKAYDYIDSHQRFTESGIQHLIRIAYDIADEGVQYKDKDVEYLQGEGIEELMRRIRGMMKQFKMPEPYR